MPSEGFRINLILFQGEDFNYWRILIIMWPPLNLSVYKARRVNARSDLHWGAWAMKVLPH